MPIHTLPDPHRIPRVDEPAVVISLTLIVVVQCKQCASPTPIGLLNTQQSVCESCGALYALDAVRWEKGNPVPSVTLSAVPSIAKSLVTS